ncbi:MAG: ABC transporter ATP-binding protein [Phenylobacterium zucineum]|nr:MAG: ABC transporter ATP-binding protein [Phenylobacterium zucineum]
MRLRAPLRPRRRALRNRGARARHGRRPARRLLAAAPGQEGSVKGLELRGVTIRYGGQVAVRDVSLALPEGRALGIVGESGSGKSSLGRVMAGLQAPTSGAAMLDGVDLRRIQTPGRASPAQLIFQNPLAALNPRRAVRLALTEALAGRGITGARADDAAEEHLALVGLSPAHGARRPSELSGGQRQRVAIARALAAEPRLIVADEITSALDVSVQASVLNLLVELQHARGFTLVFISHNLPAVRYVADDILVMRHGEAVEHGPAETLTASPSHPYTRALLDAAPRLSPQPSPEIP